MKATKYYKSDGRGFCKIHIPQRVTKKHIIMACLQLSHDEGKITRTKIENEIRDILRVSGSSRVDYFIFNDDYNSQEIETAENIAEELYPDFFIDYRKYIKK